jgi:hypothetical protein
MWSLNPLNDSAITLHYKSVPAIAQPSDGWPRPLVRTGCELKITFPVEEGPDNGNVGVHATHSMCGKFDHIGQVRP